MEVESPRSPLTGVSWLGVLGGTPESERLGLLQTIDLAAIMVRDMDGTVRLWSRGCEQLYGWTAAEAVGTRVHDLLRTRWPVPRQEVTAALEERGEWVGVLGQRSKTGLEIFVRAHKAARRDDAGRVCGVMECVTDITALRQAEEVLAQSEAWLARRRVELERLVGERTSALIAAKSLFQAVFDGQFQVMVLLSADGRIVEANRAMLEMSDQRHEEVVGRSSGEIWWWPEAERTWLGQAVTAAAAGGFVRRELEIVVADQRRLCIDFSLAPVRDSDTGEVCWIILEGRDLTERRSLETQLAQALRLQALGQLAGGIAHDFNNILQAVSGAMTLVEQRAAGDVRLLRLAQVSQNAAQRGASITRRLLAFARRGELRAEALRVPEMLADIREVLAHTLGAHITVSVQAKGGLPLVWADRGQLETSLVNLGTNARDALPDGGEILLVAEADTVPPGVQRVPSLQPGGYVRLTVRDNGSGMDPEILARASEPFFTTKAQGQGTGLGLAMVRGFVEQSGGAMRIASSPGGGTEVTLWLPVAAGAQQFDEEPVFSDAAAASSTAGRVMVIDDDHLVREVLAEQLESLGFKTTVAASGPEALSVLSADVAVDALVCDLSMPGLSGIETIRQARALRPNLPCYLLTGYMGERAALANEGLFQLVRKPVSGEMLAVQIQADLARATR